MSSHKVLKLHPSQPTLSEELVARRIVQAVVIETCGDLRDLRDHDFYRAEQSVLRLLKERRELAT